MKTEMGQLCNNEMQILSFHIASKGKNGWHMIVLISETNVVKSGYFCKNIQNVIDFEILIELPLNCKKSQKWALLTHFDIYF